MHLTPEEAAARLRHSVHTLAKWRRTGAGPKYIKFQRRVLYPLSEIEVFEARQTRSNTSQDLNL